MTADPMVNALLSTPEHEHLFFTSAEFRDTVLTLAYVTVPAMVRALADSARASDADRQRQVIHLSKFGSAAFTAEVEKFSRTMGISDDGFSALAEKARTMALHDAAVIMAGGFPEVADDECAGPPPPTPADLAAVGICPGCGFPLHPRDAECGWHEGTKG